MKTRIRKWGNSLAVRIPKSFADEVGLRQDSAVEISLAEGEVVVRPIAEPKYTLDGLLAKVNKRNLHREIDTGGAVGKEMW